MKNDCKIYWMPNALAELEQTIEYLQNNFTEKNIKISTEDRRNSSVDFSKPRTFSKIR